MRLGTSSPEDRNLRGIWRPHYFGSLEELLPMWNFSQVPLSVSLIRHRRVNLSVRVTIGTGAFLRQMTDDVAQSLVQVDIVRMKLVSAAASRVWAVSAFAIS